MTILDKAAVAACCLLLAGFPAAIASAADVQVTIDNFTFSPAEVTVPLGATVVWTNRDDIPHTVVDAAAPKVTKSAPLDTDESYKRTFAAAGTYHYFCSLHPHMQGTVVVK